MRVLILIVLTFVGHASEPDWGESNSVAYKALKTMFIFKNVEVIGMNSNIAFSKSSLNSGYRLTLSIPIFDFETDEPDRDEEVRELLKIKESKFLIFTSEKLKEIDLIGLRDGSLQTISGALKIGKKTYPLNFEMQRDGEYILGVYEGTFSQFNIEPPKVALGLVAQAKDYIKLYVRVKIKDL